jgi:1-deoxy-D-xylulose-5-phosphate synthase
LTQKGRGVESACQDPVTFHAPPKFEHNEAGVIKLVSGSSVAFTDRVSQAIHQAMANNDKVCVITAAMCQGNKLQQIRDEFPTRFFDVGICESHAVAFAAGLAKAGLRPIVDIYSTFLQRSFDQIFQEVSLQNLPVTFCLDRAGFTGPDGPTHHGTFDIAYQRMFPNMVVMAPADELEVGPMLDFALTYPGPVSIRYPKAAPTAISRMVTPIRLGQAEIVHTGADGCIVALGAMLQQASKAVVILAEKGYDIGLVNARFVKPMDEATMIRAMQCPVVLSVEEGCADGGFGSALLEICNQHRVPTQHLRRLAIPDRYILHAERDQQLAEAGLDVETLVETMLAELASINHQPSRRPILTSQLKVS